MLDATPLTGGVTSSMHAVDLRADGEVRTLVLRHMDREPWRRHAQELIGREADVLRLLAGTPVPAAELVAFDPPRLLMTRLPGALRLLDPPLEALARTLVTIHRVDAHPRAYQSWVRLQAPPEWGDRELWSWALDVIARPAPEYEGCFLHRDFHHGNVLFDGDAVSGVVDWVETSWGPADLDVAHCCTYLALRVGLDAVQAFREEYVRAGGTLTGNVHWALLDAVAMATAPTMTDAWRAALEAYVSSLRASSSRS